jgi:hypothetical protein
MRFSSTILFSLFLLAGAGLYAQQPCEVLVPELAGEYEGECRRGLAHGQGIARGTDTYEGQFRNGLPHGDGTYTWASGDVYEGRWRRGQRHGIGTMTSMRDGRPVVVEGVWSSGELKEEIGDAGTGYTVVSMRRIDAVRALQIGEGASVVFKILRAGVPMNYTDLTYTGSSGQPRILNQEIRFENVTFPFRASMRYTVPNKLRNDQFQCELEILIEEPGAWEVSVSQ